jgi:RNA-directed DNA polymerase
MSSERRDPTINTIQTRGANRLETNTEQKEISALAQLRAKLGLKAKLEPKFRFYTLYHHISKDDVLREAWMFVKRNGGSAGIDGVSIKAIEKSKAGVLGFLKDIQEELRSKTYYPKPVKRVYIPKSDGKLRPLGIPTVKDRVVQAAVLLIIEPIFEEDFLDCSYGFRPGRSAHQAIDSIKEAISKGQVEVYDADLKSYFDSIPHDKLMKALEARIADQQILKLIRKWLRTPIWEPGKPMKPNDRGTPQGGVISPLLANLYMHWFDKIFHGQNGPGTWAKATLVRYADDFVIMAKYMTNRIREWTEGKLEEKFGLTINREKTKIVSLKGPKDKLAFLGFMLRRVELWKTPGKTFCLITPSEKSLKKAKEKIRELTSPRNGYKPIREIVRELNLFLTGWGRYFGKGHPSEAFGDVNTYVQDRVYNFLMRRSQRGFNKEDKGQSWYRNILNLGIIQLTKQRLGRMPKAKVYRKAGCGKSARPV